MSDREEALKNQVVALTQDCHYLLSLLNSTDEIDWDNWPAGKKIKEDLEWSQELLEQLNRQPSPPPPAQPGPQRKQHPIRRQMPFPKPFNDPFFNNFFGNF